MSHHHHHHHHHHHPHHSHREMEYIVPAQLVVKPTPRASVSSHHLRNVIVFVCVIAVVIAAVVLIYLIVSGKVHLTSSSSSSSQPQNIGPPPLVYPTNSADTLQTDVTYTFDDPAVSSLWTYYSGSGGCGIMTPPLGIQSPPSNASEVAYIMGNNANLAEEIYWPEFSVWFTGLNTTAQYSLQFWVNNNPQYPVTAVSLIVTGQYTDGTTITLSPFPFNFAVSSWTLVVGTAVSWPYSAMNILFLPTWASVYTQELLISDVRLERVS
jgi:hypothetical protein